MKEFVIGKNDAGQRLDRWLAKTLPVLPAPLAQKYIRLKRVKVNGKGSSGMCASMWEMCSSSTSTMNFLKNLPRKMPFSPSISLS